ncbi:manganese efflux pump [Brevibacillus composti]|uniref:Putative manganese efflux pump MntP n=1 Tax=Brevibacillus composti TaxID=2796470 RepID=A0A7T5JNL3_9BACL|nr:manganese efflux pump MntP family protein [Brevibacillus composti]QQE74236.1 manganese efflux pump [Brevibacillus composti]QUO41318.1 manganese efflux pump [Brevibacillus composti]
MDLALFHWGQFLTLLIIAFALSMDAFSLGVGVGMVGIRLREIVKVSVTIGLFHIAMPLLGIAVGGYLSDMIGDIAVFVGGTVLMGIGIHMIWNGFAGDDDKSVLQTKGFGLLLFAFSVSLDALTVGFSFGLMEINRYLAVSLFGLIGGVMSYVGLMIGRSMGGWLGDYSEVLGGLILLCFGLKFIL